ncbi:hypothetical protein CROQUDRAFT_688835 [Cronartium quercuum f. sp. fusiforme G11]|uniref:Uncharacterized protein n=1 Tax=Cronartium quercuum f. sp. fusiforme G11 TaxID=708437 RepID=A0A9P6NSC9_9BASI|nr:hypothetical protein CROQUDRAFT_688835 [Cronartium quercuum f. sp. fusiforme G11]
MSSLVSGSWMPLVVSWVTVTFGNMLGLKGGSGFVILVAQKGKNGNFLCAHEVHFKEVAPFLGQSMGIGLAWGSSFTPAPPINHNLMSLSICESGSSAGPNSFAVLTPKPQSNSLVLTRSYSGKSSQDASDPRYATPGLVILTAPQILTGNFLANTIGSSNLRGEVDVAQYNSD